MQTDMARCEALDEALEAEEREIGQDPLRVVEALWNWQDETDENEIKLGCALAAFLRTGLTADLSLVLERAVKAQAKEMVGHP